MIDFCACFGQQFTNISLAFTASVEKGGLTELIHPASVNTLFQ
jgi:hypothetical protein